MKVGDLPVVTRAQLDGLLLLEAANQLDQGGEALVQLRDGPLAAAVARAAGAGGGDADAEAGGDVAAAVANDSGEEDGPGERDGEAADDLRT